MRVKVSSKLSHFTKPEPLDPDQPDRHHDHQQRVHRQRLLGLAYFWCGTQNAVELRVWATWLLYAVLVDLTNAVAEALHQPFAALSMETEDLRL